MFESDIVEARKQLEAALAHWNSHTGNNVTASSELVGAEALILLAMRTASPQDYPQALAEIEKLKGHVVKLLDKVAQDSGNADQLAAQIGVLTTQLESRDLQIADLMGAGEEADEPGDVDTAVADPTKSVESKKGKAAKKGKDLAADEATSKTTGDAVPAET